MVAIEDIKEETKKLQDMLEELDINVKRLESRYFK